MVLLRDSVKVLHLPNQNGNSTDVDELIDGRLVCPAPVQRHCARNLVVRHRLVEETPCCRIAVGGKQITDSFA